MGAENRRASRFYTFVIASVAALGGLLFGFDSGVINGTVTALGHALGSSEVGTGFSVASVLLGCAVGALFAGRLADGVGRRPTMTVTAIVFAVSAWGSGIADSSTEFVAYRLLGGLAVGAASVIAPAYISEVAPPGVRGRLASLQQLAIVVGLFAAFLSNYALARASGGAEAPFWLGVATWRWMYWVEIVPAAAFLAGSLVIPESPRFLVAAGREDDARRVFARVADDDTEEILAAVRATVAADHAPRLADLRTPGTRAIRPIVWVGIGLSVLQQLVGINVVFYYGEVLWRAAGFSESDALLTNVLTGFTNIASTFVAIALIDRVGRKPLLLAGSAGMTVTLGVLAWIFGTGAVDSGGQLALDHSSGAVALWAANLYVVFFAVSWGPAVWVLLGEMFENRIRGTALAVSASAQWIANFAVTMTFPILARRGRSARRVRYLRAVRARLVRLRSRPGARDERADARGDGRARRPGPAVIRPGGAS